MADPDGVVGNALITWAARAALALGDFGAALEVVGPHVNNWRRQNNRLFLGVAMVVVALAAQDAGETSLACGGIRQCS